MANDVIRSVNRIFKIFELFQKAGEPMMAIDISKRLDLPLTSTHALLNSMKTLEYLDYDKTRRAFFPSQNLIKLFEWLTDRVEDEGQIAAFLEKLNTETSETISLIRQLDTDIKIIYGLDAIYPISVRMQEGLVLPITKTVSGICIMAALTDDEKEELEAKVAKYSPGQSDLLTNKSILEKIETTKKDGYLVGYDVQMAGVSAICMPFISNVSKQKLVISIVAPTERLKENVDTHVKTLKRYAKQYNIKPVFPLKVGR